MDNFDKLHEEAFDELVESMISEIQIHHMTSKERMDAKKYRKSAKGKKALAKYARKLAARGGRALDKSRSKLAKLVAKFRKKPINSSVDESEFEDYMLYVMTGLSEAEIQMIDAISEDVQELTQEQDALVQKAAGMLDEALAKYPTSDELAESFDLEEKANIDFVFDQIEDFFESCNFDPETGDSENIDELEHMTAKEKLKNKVYRNKPSVKAAEKKARQRRKNKPVDPERSKMQKKVAAFRNESVNDTFDIDPYFIDAVLNADEIIEDWVENGVDIDAIREACEKLKIDEDEKLIITVPVDDSEDDAISLAADETDCEILSKEDGIYKVKGTFDQLEAFLDKANFDDVDIEDIIDVDDTDDIDEAAYKLKSASERAANRRKAKKYRMTAGYRKSQQKYNRKASRAGYRVDKTRSANMKKIAKVRSEAIKESINARFATFTNFGGLNEDQTTELKLMAKNVIGEMIDNSIDKIVEDIDKATENYINEVYNKNVMDIFEQYKEEIVDGLYERTNGYLKVVADDVVNKLEGKHVFIKSPKFEMMEGFTNKLIALIKEDLKIVPEQEDALVAAREKISEISEQLEDAKIENESNKQSIIEAKKEAYMYKNMPSNLSEMKREDVIEYCKNELTEASYLDFKKGFDDAVKRALSEYKDPRSGSINESNNKQPESSRSFLEMFRAK